MSVSLAAMSTTYRELSMRLDPSGKTFKAVLVTMSIIM